MTKPTLLHVPDGDGVVLDKTLVLVSINDDAKICSLLDSALDDIADVTEG